MVFIFGFKGIQTGEGLCISRVPGHRRDFLGFGAPDPYSLPGF